MDTFQYFNSRFKYLTRTTLIVFTCFLLSACSSTQNENNTDSNYKPERQDLYDGTKLSSVNQRTLPTTEAEALEAAKQAEQQRSIDKALFAYIQALDFNPQNAETFYNIGRLHLTRGNAQLAYKAFKEALALNENLVYAHSSIGILLMKKKKIDEAEVHLGKAISLDQIRLKANIQDKSEHLSALDMLSPLKAYSAMGVTFDLKGEHELAQKYFMKTVVFRPTSAPLTTNLGYSYYLSGNYAAAEKYLKTAIDNHPKYHRAWTNLGLVYIKRGMNARALSTFEQVMSEADALNDLGYFLMLEGKHAQAEKLFQQAINASPQYFEQAQKNLKRVQAELQTKSSGTKRLR